MRISDWSSDVCSSDLPMSESTSDLPEGGTFDRLKAKAKQVAGEVLDRGDLAAEGRLEEASIERADEAREQVAEAERAETEAELETRLAENEIEAERLESEVEEQRRREQIERDEARAEAQVDAQVDQREQSLAQD